MGTRLGGTSTVSQMVEMLTRGQRRTTSLDGMMMAPIVENCTLKTQCVTSVEIMTAACGESQPRR